MRVRLVMGLLLAMLWSERARAEEPEPTPPQAAPDLAACARTLSLLERLLLRQQWEQQRERERASVGVGGPVVGVVLGALAAGGSVYLFTGDRNERIGGGGLALFVAAPLLGVSIALLVERVGKRRAIERQLLEAPPIARGNPFLWTF